MNNTIAAKIIFDEVIEDAGLENIKATECENESISSLNNDLGWLPAWMLKADEVSAAVLGYRLFDTTYIKEDTSLTGFTPKDCDSNSHAGYSNFPIHKPGSIPYSLMFLICKQAIISSMKIENGQAVLLDNHNRYSPPAEDKVIPFPDKALLHSNNLRDLTRYIVTEQMLINAKRRQVDLEI